MQAEISRIYDDPIQPPTILEWHYWKDEKPKGRRWVVYWRAGDREFTLWANWKAGISFRSSNPTKWAYLPTQREMVG